MLPPPLRLLRTVTEDGMFMPRAEPLLGDPLGGVSTGAGNFDLAFCTRSSKLCILPRKLRNWTIEDDFGRPVGMFGCFSAGLPRLCLYVEFGCVLPAIAIDEPRA